MTTASSLAQTTDSKALSVSQLVAAQRAFFTTHATRDLAFREAALRKFIAVIKANEQQIIDALQADFRKPIFEGYASEIGAVIGEAKIALKNLHKWAKPERVWPSVVNMPSSDSILREPYGVTLIIGAWNYPLHLTFMPMIGALAAGNCIVLKPSEVAAASSAILTKICREAFDPSHIVSVEGDASVATELLNERWDYIFYTGSTRIGQVVMQAATKHLTPVTLELGGKSPCWVLPDANLAVAARRIAWGKFLNAGQTCIAPDYVLVHASVKEQFVAEMRKAIEAFYGSDPRASGDYAHIVSDKHFYRLTGFLDNGTIAHGGLQDLATRYLSPTLLDNITWESPIMQEEIFGPILPILTYESFDEAIDEVRAREKPLAMYIFTENGVNSKRLQTEISFGGGCVNDTIVHLLNDKLPFGGVGQSGMGAYHGRYTFETFSHRKSIVNKPTWIDIALRYPPYKDKLALLKRFLG